VDADD
jgi:hypothetical protein